jgi:dipeptide/tripeptide permease
MRAKSLIESLRQFSQTFWAAIIVELFHCLASYCMLAYLIVYLAQDLGFGEVKANFMYGTMLFMGYFLPILIGAIADRYGFRQTMVVSLVIITSGYFLASQMTAYPWMFVAMMTIALGGAVMKPVIAGTVKAASTDENRTLGFSIYYMIINVGGFIGPFLANWTRLSTGLSWTILAASGAVEASALLVSFFMFKNIPVTESARAKSFVTVMNEMVIVLCNLRLFITGLGLAGLYVAGSKGWMAAETGWFAAATWIALNLAIDFHLRSREKSLGPQPQLLQPQRLGDWKLLLFILIFSGVWALYSQIWTNIPLYITSMNPAMKERIEWFQAVDPIMIVCFQVLIGKWMSRFRPLPSMVVGILIASVAVSTVNLFGWNLGAWAVGISLAIWSIGEMMFSPRSVEYVSVIAPKDKLALYIGYGFLPYAIGFGVGPSVGVHLVKFFRDIKHPDWVWYAFGLWSVLVALALWAYDWMIRFHDRAGKNESTSQ